MIKVLSTLKDHHHVIYLLINSLEVMMLLFLTIYVIKWLASKVYRDNSSQWYNFKYNFDLLELQDYHIKSIFKIFCRNGRFSHSWSVT